MYTTDDQLWKSFSELAGNSVRWIVADRGKPVTQKQLLKAEQKSHRELLGMA